MSLTNTARSKSQPGGLEQVVERPVPLGEHRPDRVVGLAGEVEPLGDDDLPAVQFVHVAEFGLRLGDDAAP